MGKKNVNPADAFRKAERKKEQKKNKAERSKARDFALVKKDTRDIEDEIEKIEGLEEKSASQKSRLSELKADLAKINQKKEEYVAEHPEQRKLVYRPRHRDDRDKDGEKPPAPVIQKRNLFNKNGLPRHPERSIYYDPVMNPYGVPPPGMHYMERPLRLDEVNSDEEDDDDEDGIAMPAGPPPVVGDDSDEDGNDSDDDIPMPEGPPPGTVVAAPPLPPSLPLQPTLPPPPPPVPFQLLHFPSNLLPPHLEFPPHVFPSPPPIAVPGYPPQQFPPPPLGFPVIPPPPFPSHVSPPPPPGFFPRGGPPPRMQNIQDPLSSVPHQTYRAHQQAKRQQLDGPPTLPTPHPSLPARPEETIPVPSAKTGTSTPASAAVVSAATVFAQPELRDFKKESTAFIPATLKRKKPGSGRVNAAPSLGAPPSGDGVLESDEVAVAGPARPDLLGTLRNNLNLGLGFSPQAEGPAAKRLRTSEQQKDDYAKFLEDMGDVLGSSK